MSTYTISGEHAVRLAARDGLTIRSDGSVVVTPTGWTGAADGYSVEDYFRGAVYLGPDDYGIEPTWRDAAREIIEASVTVEGEDYLARGDSDHVSICRREGGRWLQVGIGTWDGQCLECDAPLDSAVYDALEARIGGAR